MSTTKRTAKKQGSRVEQKGKTKSTHGSDLVTVAELAAQYKEYIHFLADSLRRHLDELEKTGDLKPVESDCQQFLALIHAVPPIIACVDTALDRKGLPVLDDKTDPIFKTLIDPYGDKEKKKKLTYHVAMIKDGKVEQREVSKEEYDRMKEKDNSGTELMLSKDKAKPLKEALLGGDPDKVRKVVEDLLPTAENDPIISTMNEGAENAKSKDLEDELAKEVWDSVFNPKKKGEK